MPPLGDSGKMGEAIVSLVFDPEKRKAMEKRCRNSMTEGYALNVQARRYRALFEELHHENKLAVPDDIETVKTGSRPIPSASVTEISSVHLETGVGTHFRNVYDQVLFKALEEFVPHLQEKLEASEADRDARLEVIEDLGSQLEASEADRDARLEVIEDLGSQLEASEADRDARLEVIEDLGSQLEASEADRDARLEVIERSGDRNLRQARRTGTQWLEVIYSGNGTEIIFLQQKLLVRILRRLNLLGTKE